LLSKILSLLFFLTIIPYASAKTESECLNSLSEIVQGDEVKEEKLKEFLKLQAGLTMHKLALATFSKDINKTRFTLEGEILSILDKMDDSRKDEEFDRVYKMFKHPKNKLSRHALADVLPLIQDILNEQNKETDPVKRQLFNLDISDIKMLSILTEKEKQYNNGSYAQILSANRESDNSILNFTKIINASIRNTNASNESIRDTMKRRLKNLNTQANKLIIDILSGTECDVLLQACSQKTKDGTTVISENVLENLVGIAQKLTNPDKHKYLRYGDVWLYTKWRKETKRPTPKKYTYYQTRQKSDDDIIQDYLIQHVLDSMPFFFTDRKQLEDDPELTLALARAIDRGAVTSTDLSKRVFNYKGKEYMIPETWNGSYDDIRPVKFLKETWDDITGFFSTTDNSITIPDTIDKDDAEAFLKTRNDQRDVHGRKLAFEFKGKLYNLDGTPIEKNPKSLLLYPTGKNVPVEKMELSKEDKKEIAIEIADENHSYIKEGKVFFISGVEVNFDKAYNRDAIIYGRTNYSVKGREKINYPPASEVKNLMANNTQMAPIILKGIADRNYAVTSNDGKMIDLIKLKVVPRKEVQNIIIEHRLGQGGVSRTPAQLNFDNDYLSSNAAAILNNKPSFRVGDKKYHTNSGFAVGQKGKDNTLMTGMTSHEEKHEEIISLNSLPQMDMIVEYHKSHPNKACTYYTVLDKSKGKLTVLFQDGKIAFEDDALVGSEVGDERTKYFGELEDRVTNNKTGAGIFNLGTIKNANLSDHFSQFEGNYLTLTSGSDKSVNTGLHQVSTATPERNTFLNNNDPTDNRATAGGVSLSKSSMQNFISNYYKEGCPFYIIPETDKVKFKVKGDQLVFETASGSDPEQYLLSHVEKEVPKKIIASMNDERYINDYTTTYIHTLQERKADIMKHLDITNDEYNELLKISFGVLGTETEFAEDKFYKFKETKTGQMLITDMKKYGKVGGSIKFATTTGLLRFLGFEDNPDNSHGSTQIKNVDEYVPDEFGIGSGELGKPENAAIATMFVLANKYKILKNCEDNHAAITDKNRMEFLYYMYMGSTDQICSGGNATVKYNPKADKVRQYANSITISEEP
jgi:hypothetical protein